MLITSYRKKEEIMRTLLIFLLLNSSAYAYSCLPPTLGGDSDGCRPKYFTLQHMEDTIHGLKGVTREGKNFIYKEILRKKKRRLLTLNLRVFSKELCLKSKELGVDIYNDGSCPVEFLSYSLVPYGEFNKLSGSIDLEIDIGSDGKPSGGTIRGSVNF